MIVDDGNELPAPTGCIAPIIYDLRNFVPVSCAYLYEMSPGRETFMGGTKHYRHVRSFVINHSNHSARSAYSARSPRCKRTPAAATRSRCANTATRR